MTPKYYSIRTEDRHGNGAVYTRVRVLAKNLGIVRIDYHSEGRYHKEDLKTDTITEFKEYIK